MNLKSNFIDNIKTKFKNVIYLLEEDMRGQKSNSKKKYTFALAEFL